MGAPVGRRVLHKLSAAGIRKINAPGYYGDGGGLVLQVGPTGSQSWLFRFVRAGRMREMGLGATHTVSLAEAREKARQQRALLLEGVDPIEARNASKRTASAATAKALTFDECAERYIAAHEPGWRNAKHGDQWRNTLSAYASPIIGKLDVAEVDTGLVMKVLEPIWTKVPESASRLRGRIESILAWATVRGYRKGDNPAQWRNHLDQLLPGRLKVRARDHHAAMPYARMGEFMKALREQDNMSARAVELIVLTAARTSEVFNARWLEFDLDLAVWTVPAERMKAHKEHRVPLSPVAVKMLKKLQEVTGCESYVFPGAKEGKPLSNMAGLKLLQRMGHGDITVHGFRSTFRDWAAERTNYPREVAEAALAHTVADRVEAAYRRGDLFEKRRRLMNDWATYCGRVEVPATVTPIRKGNKS